MHIRGLPEPIPQGEDAHLSQEVSTTQTAQTWQRDCGSAPGGQLRQQDKASQSRQQLSWALEDEKDF